MSWHINILTLFPEMFPGFLGHSLAGKALERGDWSCDVVNIRDVTEDVHKTVDDTPYGGGAGMVMRADIIEKALLSLCPSPSHPSRGPLPLPMGEGNDASPSGVSTVGEGLGRKIYLSPRGKRLDQKLAQDLSQTTPITLLCGRYEGVDQRLLDAYEFEEISIGDYVLSGGEPAALTLMDSCIRLLPGVLGNADTPREESFSPGTGGLLEYPHYTRPADWTTDNGQVLSVPDILTSGDHGKIAAWRKEQAETITKARRPDLLLKKKETP